LNLSEKHPPADVAPALQRPGASVYHGSEGSQSLRIFHQSMHCSLGYSLAGLVIVWLCSPRDNEHGVYKVDMFKALDSHGMCLYADMDGLLFVWSSYYHCCGHSHPQTFLRTGVIAVLIVASCRRPKGRVLVLLVQVDDHEFQFVALFNITR
jgi:hypothetical protein